MPLLRACLCLALVASPALAQVPRSEAVGAKADHVPPKPFTEPLMAKADFHVHIKADLTLDDALRRSSADGIYYGIVINGGLGFPVSADAGLEAFLAGMRGKPAYVAFQAEGREWVRLFSKQTLEKFDYVFTDAMTWTDDNGKRMRLWMADEVGTIADPQAFMDTLVSRAAGIFANEPIDIYVNPTFIPAALQKDYDSLWTPARMKTIVDGLAASGIAMEINNRYRIPSAAFIRLAKQSGITFACGTNNTGAADLGRNRYLHRDDPGLRPPAGGFLDAARRRPEGRPEEAAAQVARTLLSTRPGSGPTMPLLEVMHHA